jgi:oligoendopeptidase F
MTRPQRAVRPDEAATFLPRPVVGRAALVALVFAFASPAAARERSEVPEAYRWNLADLYPSEAAWKQSKEELAKRVQSLAERKGHLGDSAGALLAGLSEMFGVDRDLSRLVVYASSLSDEDTRATRSREMRQEAERLAVDFGSAASFVRPEILSLAPEKVRSFLAQEKRLEEYRVYLEDILRWKPHTLSAAEERIAADAGNLTDAGQSAYGILKDADLPYPTVKLSDGKEVRLDASAFTLVRASRVRADRDKVFDAFFGAFRTFQRTMGATLYAQVRGHVFDEKVHGFGSSLEAALFQNDIPTAVYRQLVADVHRSLPALHRYLQLRRRMLALDELRYQDLYVPLVETVDMTFAPEEARAITLQAFAPLGKDYVAALKKGYESRWTDFLPSTGKRPGAYSTGVYGVHPYQLLNFNGKYEDLSTLAHESGHSMHTWLSHSSQPYPTADYAIFVAEVASTLNENLLFHHMLSNAKDEAVRLFLLGNHLETLRTTLFRQTLFAEFELAAHEKAERGETLTGEGLSALYLGLLRQYYGHDRGVCKVDDLMAVEWAYIPHFYYDFYVYQYATSLVASTSLAKAIREEAARRETRRRDAYLAMLRSGRSRYPIDLLRRAGVDMTTSAPFDAAIAEMNATIDEMERILARQKKAGR